MGSESISGIVAHSMAPKSTLTPSSTKGIGLVGIFLSMLGAVSIALVSYAAFQETRKAYWDRQIDGMCRKDGGLTVFQKESLTLEEYKRIGGLNSGLPIPNRNEKTGKFPYVREEKIEKLRNRDPEVVRMETLISRRIDGKVLAKTVIYWRSGGDFLAIDAPSSFICPRPTGDFSRQIFTVEQDPKSQVR
jgi:hypothetical protein